MKLRIVHYPHPALRCRALPIRDASVFARGIVGEMFQLMYESKGVGLAAPQVGLPYQLIVLNLSGDKNKKNEEKVYLNPSIVGRAGIDEGEEGCLSLPGLFGPVRRARSVVVQAKELSGRSVEIRARGLASRVWQHEIDHLAGILFIDRLSAASRLASQSALDQFERTYRAAQANGRIPPDDQIARDLAEHQNGCGISGGPDEAGISR